MSVCLFVRSRGKADMLPPRMAHQPVANDPKRTLAVWRQAAGAMLLQTHWPEAHTGFSWEAAHEGRSDRPRAACDG